eukprot:s8_g16.t1
MVKDAVVTLWVYVTYWTYASRWGYNYLFTERAKCANSAENSRCKGRLACPSRAVPWLGSTHHGGREDVYYEDQAGQKDQAEQTLASVVPSEDWHQDSLQQVSPTLAPWQDWRLSQRKNQEISILLSDRQMLFRLPVLHGCT